MTASRKVGGAVVRNRIKRSIRTWFRTRYGELEEAIDIVVIARRGAAKLRGAEIAAQLNGLTGLSEKPQFATDLEPEAQGPSAGTSTT